MGGRSPGAMTRRVPRSASAWARSSTPSKWMTSLPPDIDISATVSGPASAGSVRNTEPAAKRSSGVSVIGWTNRWPRTPRAGPIRPTVMSSAAVDIDDVDADPLAADAMDHLAQCLGGTAVAADHATQVLGVHAHLEPLAAPVVDQVDLHVVRMVDDAPHQVFEGLLEHVSSPPTRLPRPRPWAPRPWAPRPWAPRPWAPRPWALVQP